MSPRLRLVLKLIVTAGLLASVIYRIDLQAFWEVISSANPLLLLAAGAVQALTVLISSGRWRVILRNFNVEETFSALAKITFIGFFFNLFLPSGIGGDFFRSYYLSKRTGRGMSTTLMTLILDRSAGLLALLLIGLAATLVYPLEIGGINVFWIFSGIFLAYLAANLVLFHSVTHRLLKGLMRRFKRDGLEQKVELVALGLRTLRRNPQAVLKAAGYSLAIQFLAVLVVWLAALSIQLPADFGVFLIFIPLVNLTIMVPITINGVGLRETVYIELFQTIGVSQEYSVSLALLHLGVFLLAGLPGGIVYHLYKKDERFDEIATAG
ncbi:MAG TPA: lysylphosphatidylglycerol synthase transmembrane domain-containing protein [Acidobacteriota bacterium]|nr:lysylphosphatidylglycerol synthase transmembrane domain-containing protein [Acidobacteriota bacterium]